MKQYKKRLVSFLLALIMVAGMLPQRTFAAGEGERENPWQGKSAVFVGDSITAGSGTEKIYYQYLSEMLGFGAVTAMGVAGSCISSASDYGQSNQPLIGRYESIPSADLMVIFMGTNDYGHETPLGTAADTQEGSFYGALNTIIPALVEKHTSSKIVFVTPMHRYGFGTSKILGTQFTYDSIPNGVGATLGDYMNALKAVCAANGVSVIDLHTECTLDPSDAAVRTAYMPDGLHPNAAGHEVIAGIMASHIQKMPPPEGTEEQTELIYGNKFAAGFDQQNRASSRTNLYLKAGTVVALKEPEIFQWTCAKTSNESSSNNLGYFPDSAWTDKVTAVVEVDSWVGFAFKYRDESQTFDLSKPLSDYIHVYTPVVTAATCTEQGYTTYTCDCGDSYVGNYIAATGHSRLNGVCVNCGDSFAGKKVSILSHSMSTYAGVSNDTSANSTIGSNDVYYTAGKHDVYREDTWWQQTIDALDMELLVNNSWSGSCIFQPRKGAASVGYGDRAVNLHNDHTGEEPDVIFVYLGCNDFAYFKDTFGKAADADYTAIIQANSDGSFAYAAPGTACEAYAIMLHKVQTRYPDAEIYCMTSTARRDPDYADNYADTGQPTEYMAQLHQVAAHFGHQIVDLEDCIPKEAEIFDQYIGDKRAHANTLGMDKITNEVLSVMLGKDAEIRHVTSADGTAQEQAVLLGGSYCGEVEIPEGCSVVVTMGGVDITGQVYSDGRVVIAEVTGDIEIHATLRNDPLNFRWEVKDGAIVSAGQTENTVTYLAGTMTNGIINDGRYEIGTPVVLRHDLPWEVEWQCSGDWRGAVLSSDPAQQTKGMIYISRTKGGQLCIGTYNGSQYDNYGIDLSTLDDQTHTFRLVNRIAADGSNMVWLYVDDVKIGSMNNYFIGSNSQNKTSNWISGKDFVFGYMGMDGHPLKNLKLDYIQVWENGEPKTLSGKTISILGDSISTYQNYSNGTAEQTTNSTIGSGAIYYPRDGFDVTADSTWWYQAAQVLDLEILVNNSWSGSCLLNTRSGTVGAYIDRCVQLHDNTGTNAGEEPDIIAIFLGTNDYYTYSGTLGSYESIDFDALITKTDEGYAYAEPVTSMEAYAIMLHKIGQRYPEAEVYCLTLLPRVNSTSQPTAVNEDIRQLAEHFGAVIVDLYDCGVQPDSTHMGDNLHPNSAGMDVMTNAFVSAVLKNSKYAPEQTLYDVTFELDDVVAMEGTVRTVVAGEALTVTLACAVDLSRLDVTVKMGGVDVTAQYYADGVVQIPAVSGNVEITASVKERDPLNFRWEYDARKNAMVSVLDGSYTENELNLVAGSITDGKLSKVKYTLSEAVILKHDQPWIIEWKSEGTWTDTTDGALLFAGAENSAAADTPYLYRRHNSDFIAFGVYTGGQYHNYGTALKANGIDGTVEHVYRLENRIADDGSNMVYLFVDNKEIGPMNHHWVGGTDKKETVDWLNGQDLVFNRMGTNPHTIGNCYIDYVQVWEKGHNHSYENGTCTGCGQKEPVELYSYRWQIENNAMISVTTNGNTANHLTLTSGSVTGGVLKNIRGSLNEAVNLYHDVPWVIEWRSSGNWDGMLLASNADTSVYGTSYLFRFSSMNFIALGDHTNTWNNYGLIHEIDMTIPHLFRLENRIGADGANTVYLLVDGVEIDAMHHYYNSGTNQNQIVNWANGRDLVFGNIGTSSHPMNNMQLEYLQIWENGHEHNFRIAVTAPTCAEKGYTTYICDCGSSYAGNYVDANGHSYVNGSCAVCGKATSTPYAGKTIACIGDSITAAYGVTKDKTDYVKLLADRLEMNYIRLGASGTTLSTDGSRTCNIDKLTESKLQGADVVTIAMGINDFCGAGEGYYELGDIRSTDSSTIYGAVRMWCERIIELRKTDSLSDTEFYFVTPLITSWNNSVTSARNWDQSKVNIHGYALRDLCNAIIEVAALYDVEVIDLNLISGLYYVSAEDNNVDVFGGDGVHPGDEGHAMMAAALEDALLKHYLLDDHDHSYGSWIITTYPDCEDGEEKRVCEICRATESRKLAGKGHSYENGICIDCGVEHPELADYAGKVISIMGDSISTFAGYIPVADGFNMEHLARYPQDNLLTDVNETWWMQVVAALDAKLGINDSWRGATLSGGAPVTTGTTGENAAMSNLIRIQNLGSNGTPDVILLYGGTNDLAHVSKIGTFDPETAPTQVDLTTKKWDNLADGFVHTILRMRYYYPDAVIVAMLPTYTASYYSNEKLAQGNAVMAEICKHYGIAYVDLRESGVTAKHLPDGIHPGEEGMDLITAAVVDALLKQQDLQAGENVVYAVSHELKGVKASLGHWKGVSAGKAFVETLTGDDLTVTVTMGGEDVTEKTYANGVISIEEVTGALVITAKGIFIADGHLQLLPENAYNTTNLWDVLEHDREYYTVNGWDVHSSSSVKSVTVPVIAGDRIWATSFGAAGSNGTSINGIRVSYFTEEGLLKTMSPDEVYREFSKNGYLTVPEGAVAVNVPMWRENNVELYILTLPAIPSEKNVHLNQNAKLETDGSFTFKLEIYASEKVALYEDAVIRYVLSRGFVMTDKSEIKALRVSELLSDAVLYEVSVEATELTVAVNDGVLDVTGFDLNKEYITQDHAGSKLVITISNVEATDEVCWNENMDISTADSGIWVDGELAVAFVKSSALFRESVYVMDYAEEITLEDENILHLDADGMDSLADATDRLEMTYGTAQIKNGSVVYVPDTMQWNGYDRFYAFAGQNEAYQWTKMAVIPANNVYYEDTCIAISAEEATQGAGIYYTNGTKPENVAQDVWDDWCGLWESVSDNKTGNPVEDSSDVQGWIENLAGQTGFTGGSAHLVQAMLGQSGNSVPKATFTFTGTGVDIYSFTNNTTGTVIVQVSDVKGIYPSSYYIVDTGMNTETGFYQVPTISFAGKGYSTYQVTIMVTTGAAKENRFAFYLDGIRVYNPLAEDAKDTTVEDAYGDEMQAVFGSVRQMLLDVGSFTGETGEGTGFVFLDRLPDEENSGSTNVIGVYEAYGPKNEVYLAKGQAIAFKVNEDLYSRVQVGLKSLTGEKAEAVVSYFDEETAAAAQGLISLSHTADLYYELMPMDGYVVIRNNSDAILAVTKVKLMTTGDPKRIAVKVEKISQAEILAAVEDFEALPVMAYSLRTARPDVDITDPEISADELAAAQLRALIEKIFGSVRKWFD